MFRSTAIVLLGAMEGANAEQQRPRRRSWRKRTQQVSHRLLCCSCLRGEERDHLQQQEKEINGNSRHPQLDPRGSGERGAIQITVEGLGIVNSSFSLCEEDDTARSASSVSACLRPLFSLPMDTQEKLAVTSTSGGGDEEEEDDPLGFESGTDVPPAPGSFLSPPVINLIPPTPSDVIDDDQFFDINLEDIVANNAVAGGGFGAGDHERNEESTKGAEAKGSTVEFPQPENKVSADRSAEPEEGLKDPSGEEEEAETTKDGDLEKTIPGLLHRVYQVAPLPTYKKNELSNRDVNCCDMLKAELCLLPANMDTFTHQRRLIKRSCSLEDTPTRSATFHALTQTTDHQEDERSLRQRRITVASYAPQSQDQNGNFPEKDVDRQVAKCLGELSTDEVCRWFTNIGLQKCLPFIRDVNLCGADVASVDVNTLDVLHITTLEEREQLLSAIYKELHPSCPITQRLDSLIDSLGSNNVETFTATLVSMSKSKSAPHVSCLSMNRRSLKRRNTSQTPLAQRNSHLIEITINASERIVHLRTPKETTVGKIMDSCIKMLGMTEDGSLFILREKQGSSEDLPPDQAIASLLTSTSEDRQLELHLCRKEGSSGTISKKKTGVHSSNENNNINKNVLVNQPAKEERIKELNQQVESLRNVILQVQELHHGLVAFCSEIKNMDGDVDVDRLSFAELKERSQLVKSRLYDKRRSLQTLRDNVNDSTAHKKKQLDVRLLEKMKLNCQVFKEEISMVHLNRQMAHLQNALQESYVKGRQRTAGGEGGQLSPLCG
ncbi:uncharacterized protein AB9W97_019787 isoform 2-T3 [Spinachia spinachia]